MFRLVMVLVFSIATSGSAYAGDCDTHNGKNVLARCTIHYRTEGYVYKGSAKHLRNIGDVDSVTIYLDNPSRYFSFEEAGGLGRTCSISTGLNGRNFEMRNGNDVTFLSKMGQSRCQWGFSTGYASAILMDLCCERRCW